MRDSPKLLKKFLMTPGAETLEQIKCGFVDDQHLKAQSCSFHMAFGRWWWWQCREATDVSLSCPSQRPSTKTYFLFDVKSKLSLASSILYNQDPTLQLYFSNCHYIFASGKIFTCHFKNIPFSCTLVNYFLSKPECLPPSHFYFGYPVILLSSYFLLKIIPTPPEGSEPPSLWNCPAELLMFILPIKLHHSFKKSPLMAQYAHGVHNGQPCPRDITILVIIQRSSLLNCHPQEWVTN